MIFCTKAPHTGGIWISNASLMIQHFMELNTFSKMQSFGAGGTF